PPVGHVSPSKVRSTKQGGLRNRNDSHRGSLNRGGRAGRQRCTGTTGECLEGTGAQRKEQGAEGEGCRVDRKREGTRDSRRAAAEGEGEGGGGQDSGEAGSPTALRRPDEPGPAGLGGRSNRPCYRTAGRPAAARG